MSTFGSLGSTWGLWPLYDPRKGINRVEGVGVIVQDLITLTLLQPGEHPLYPDIGYAPPLFSNTSSSEILSLDYYRIKLIESIQKYTQGKIAEFAVRLNWGEQKGTIKIEIDFRPSSAAGIYYLKFDRAMNEADFPVTDLSLNNILLLSDERTRSISGLV